MAGFRRTFLCLLITSYFLAGCGGTSAPPNTERDTELAGKANRFVDWNAENWRFILPFNPTIYPESVRFNNLKYDSPYDDFTHYRPQFEALSLAEFRKLPTATRNKRRQASQKTLYNAMAFKRIMSWSWEIWTYSQDKQVADEAWLYKYGIITPAISYLEQAAGEDPENPFTWSHLSFFTGLVGNTARKLQALENGFETLADYQQNNPELSPAKSKELHLMQLRMLLDRAWVRRDKAHFEDSMEDVKTALKFMSRDNYRTYDIGREALLLKALLLVETGFYSEAKNLANQFKKWTLPNIIFSGGSIPSRKGSFEQIESDFSRQWVWDLIHMKQGSKARALRPMGNLAGKLSYPPHLGYRYWQDMGRIREHFGEREKASSLYFLGFMNRPFLSFFPTLITTGYTPIFGQEDSGNFHFLSYRDFFVGGSEFAYAANRVSKMERAFGKKRLTRLGNEAVAALTTCYEKGTRPLSSLALRGYAYTLLDQPTLAEQDLIRADTLMTEAGREDSNVIRLLATLYYNRQSYEESHLVLARYLTMKPEDAPAWRFDGLILAEMGHYKESLSALDVALKIDPNSVSALYNRAIVLLHLGHLEKAQNDLRLALELSPDNSAVLRLTKLISNDPEIRVEFTHKPQKWSISPPETDGQEELNPAAGLSGDTLLAIIEKLRNEFSEKPSRQSRLALGYALNENHQWAELQGLMAPMWPDRITLEGTLLLLQADRTQGKKTRAVELAQSLDTDSSLIGDPRLWTIVAVICHESGETLLGNQALELALQLDPQNQALYRMQSHLKN